LPSVNGGEGGAGGPGHRNGGMSCGGRIAGGEPSSGRVNCRLGRNRIGTMMSVTS